MFSFVNSSFPEYDFRFEKWASVVRRKVPSLASQCCVRLEICKQ